MTGKSRSDAGGYFSGLMTRAGLAAGVMFAGFAAPAPLLAEQVNLQRYNIAPDAPGALVAPLEQRRRALLKRMQADPGDLDAAFAYAQASARLGDLEGAIATYERMLIRVPNTPRLQLELGALYFRLGAFDNSRAYFQQVLARPDTPPEVRNNISTFMLAMNGSRKKGGVTGQLTYGLRHQSNANAGPNNPVVNLMGRDFVLDDLARGRPDTSAVLGLTLGYLQPLSYRGVAMQYSLDVNATEFRERTDISTEDVEIRLGPVFLLDRYGIKGGRLSVAATLGGGRLGDAPNYLSYGLSVGYQMPLSRKSGLRLAFDYRDEDYRATAKRPLSNLLSGERYRLTGMITRQLGQNLQGFIGAGLERRTAERDYTAYWEGSTQFGLSYRYTAPFKVTERPWTLTLLGRVSRRVNDAPNPIVSSTEKQKGNDYYLQLIQNVPLNDKVGLQVYGGYRSVRSNYDIRTFHDASVGVSVIHNF
ncbi:tetratricopeptide repeat protein [Paracoccus aminophilus]|uniref:Uncharacterized protein n=1 Tax=Paracoccus aminophilus JCM 7686 TaxID=1367847 RepID=S5YI60_PARAH|nr:tetratricopeptide repeat protein [Paracoccus aminophilus]AGT11163.1 hypothetical protein JCM7686_pAMI5p097 [Paracoccus aminophilus JCM 7686]